VNCGADKLAEISTEQLRRNQRNRMTPEEIYLLDGLNPQSPPEPVQAVSAEPSLESVKDHIFERVSVARDYEILMEALRNGRGEIIHQELTLTLGIGE